VKQLPPTGKFSFWLSTHAAHTLAAKGALEAIAADTAARPLSGAAASIAHFVAFSRVDLAGVRFLYTTRRGLLSSALALANQALCANARPKSAALAAGVTGGVTCGRVRWCLARCLGPEAVTRETITTLGRTLIGCTARLVHFITRGRVSGITVPTASRRSRAATQVASAVARCILATSCGLKTAARARSVACAAARAAPGSCIGAASAVAIAAPVLAFSTCDSERQTETKHECCVVDEFHKKVLTAGQARARQSCAQRRAANKIIGCKSGRSCAQGDQPQREPRVLSLWYPGFFRHRQKNKGTGSIVDPTSP